MHNYLKTDFDLNSNKLVELFDELPLWAAPFGLKLLSNIRYLKGIKALDIGFGAGFPLTELAMRLGKTSTVYGIDPWRTASERAEKKIKFFGIDNVEIIQGFAEDIPLDSKTIDLIVSNNGLNNVGDLDQALSECARLVKSGGQFIQTMNLNKSMIEFYSAMEQVLLDLKLESCLHSMQTQIYKKRKPLDQYTDLIKKYGFTINSIQHDTFEYFFVDGTTMLNHHFIRLAFLSEWKEIVPKSRQKEVFELIEYSLNRQAEIDGYLKLTIPFVLIDCEKQ